MWRIHVSVSDGRMYIFSVVSKKSRDQLIAFLRNSIEQKTLSITTRKEKVIWIDAGGPVMINETKVEFRINGYRFGAFARHLPAIYNAIINSKESEVLPGNFILGCYPFIYLVVPFDMRDALSKKTKDLMDVYQKDIHETEKKLDDATDSIHGLLWGLKCIYCGADVSYSKCCGRSVKMN